MLNQIQAILWAQIRSLLNHRGRGYGKFPLAIVIAVIWYGFWCFAAWGAAQLLSRPPEPWLVRDGAATGLLILCVYWQTVPIMLASGGFALDLNRLRAYPIPRSSLFAIELLLRITVCFEVVIVMAGMVIGLAMNPSLPWWSPLTLAPIVLMNLYLSIGVRDLLTRLFSRKGIREVLVLAMVTIVALPQLLVSTNVGPKLKPLLTPLVSVGTPWGATARLMFGTIDPIAFVVLLIWCAALAWFGRSQFEMSLRFDQAAARSSREDNKRAAWFDAILALPSMPFRDPIAALIDKEVRFLSRAPRFRLLFMMGFSFGLMLWLPFTINSDPDSTMSRNYLTLVSVYALLLLGEVCFWNSFGLDRSAAQNYFVLPVKLSDVLMAKNIAGAFFIALDVGLVTLISIILRVPITLANFIEAAVVTGVVTLFLMSIGNILSMRYPRGIDPTQSWKSTSMGRVQAYLLLIYPLTGGPVMLAYGARYAFDSELAFYAVLLLDVVVGLIVYWIAMESATGVAHRNREVLVGALSSGHGPVGS